MIPGVVVGPRPETLATPAGKQSNMDLGLKGRVAVITGPAKGMGAAVSKAFAAEGCKLALIGRDTNAIEPVAYEIKASGGEAIIVPCDVTSTKACDDAAKATQDKFGGRIDILVNVAGGSGPIGKTGAQTTADEFDEIVTLNMGGCFNTMHAVVPAMMAQRYGKIVNVGGTFGMRGRAGRMAYSASKWGLRGITKSFALEVGSYNINVNCVAPGMVDGPRFRDKVCADMAKRLGITVEQAVEHHAAEYALKRVTSDADVANACLFLASDASRQITGIDLPVDGGWAML
jgi:NAD(P)-dependent dehydrogenase (short-subunit alcohol dehydrogenase family)